MKRTIWLLVILPLLVIGPASSSERVVVYSWPKSMSADHRGDYPVALLQLALAKAGAQFRAVPSDYAMTQYRTLKQLELGRGIDVVWTMTSPERERQLRPIRIPLDRGLIGYRLLAIHSSERDLFANLSNSELLKQLLTVQGIDWPDFDILQKNGFHITASNHFDGMYDMLSKKRVRYFARSVTEIWPELAARPQHQLTVAPRWVLYYPAALYFFVRRDDQQLADALEQGLQLALQDGSFRQLFLSHFHDVLRDADLAHREIVRLANPTLPVLTPLQRSELWFNPQDEF